MLRPNLTLSKKILSFPFPHSFNKSMLPPCNGVQQKQKHTYCSCKALPFLTFILPAVDLVCGSLTYLIFVLSFTPAKFLSPKILHPKTMQNAYKLQQIPPKGVKYAVLCILSRKFYTGENFYTRAPPVVVTVTNMRYGH